MGREPHMRTYHKHVVLSTMLSRPGVSLLIPCGRTEIAHKALKFNGLSPDLKRIPCYFPDSRETRHAPRPIVTGGWLRLERQSMLDRALTAGARDDATAP
jgi:hypothetical protein